MSRSLIFAKLLLKDAFVYILALVAVIIAFIALVAAVAGVCWVAINSCGSSSLAAAGKVVCYGLVCLAGLWSLFWAIINIVGYFSDMWRKAGWEENEG